MIVSGLQTTGKSTALKQLGRAHELMVRQRHDDPARIPVVYVTTPPKGSPRKLAMEFARFLGLPPIRRSYGGMIGSLSHLIRAAALTVILDGAEAITRELLDGIPVDHAAQAEAHGVA